MSLTDLKCKSSKPREKPYKLADAGGLYLKITPSGSKLWGLKYRFGGKEKLLSIGPYPRVSLLEARDARENAKKLIAAHQDPSLVKQETRRLAEESSDNSFEAVARAWLTKHKGEWSPNHSSTVLRRLEADIFPQIGKLPISDLTTPRLALIIEKIEKRGAGETARRCLQYCRAIFAYGKVKGFLQHNPADIKASDILAPQSGGHFAAMGSEQLPDFLRKLHSNEARLFRQTQIAMELMLLTFVRTAELIKAKWPEVDFIKATWTVPVSRVKQRKHDHVVPLSKRAIALFRELQELNGHRTYVFPSQRNPREHMSNNALLVALRRMGYGGIHTGHGFRALAMTTLMEELGYAYEIVDTQLSHSKGSKTRAAYDRTKYLPDRKKMMEAWSQHIEGLMAKTSLTKVRKYAKS